ncbi:MAG: GNAT family N-acetyltransferase [Pirellulaceae bacterium]|nr:GNAT family N-acetyltransferase [Pirellulaceae bacterium]
MTIRSLDKVFHPQRVAVVGASAQPGKVGHTVLRNLVAGGYGGEIYPVNPRHQSLDGRPAFAGLDRLPEVPDLAVICTPAHTVPELIAQCGEAGVAAAVIISAGFRESGSEGELREQELARQAARFPGLRIVGPNCLGIIAPPSKLNASFACGMPEQGRVAFISQSGALCTSVLDWALSEHVGFSYFVSLGNMLDVALGDLLDYFALDGRTDAVILYIESLNEAREFMSAARAFARTKPIIAYKAGRFAESAQAAASHTGALAGVDSVYEAAFARAGIERVFAVEDMFDCAELLARPKHPRGPRLAIITNAGGPGVMATDALLERQGVLARLSDQSLAQLEQLLPPAWSHGNPIDVLGDARPERVAAALRIALEDPQVDAALVVLTPQAMTDPTTTAAEVVQVAARSSKPVITSWMGGQSMSDGVRRLNEAGIPTYAAPESAVRAFMHLVSYARNRQLLYETPRDLPVEFPLDRNKLRAVFDTILSEGHDILTESTSKALLEAYEIPVSKPYVAWSDEDAVKLGRRIGYPVVMKILSPLISHKTDVGGVALDLASDDDVRAAYARMIEAAARHRPDAAIRSVTIQRMVAHPTALEMIVGAKRDPVFGMVLLVGTGGVAAEVYHDRALELPPLNERLARRMLESLRCWPLLQGYRGRPAMPVDRLIEILIRLSYLVADYPEIQELDVNPLLVTPDRITALDARIILDRASLLSPARPYSHLAIRPYPEEYIRPARLRDRTPVLLRPIKPEDEPMWHELLASCSRQSLWLRFRYLFQATTHEMATRFCFIDYDREIAIVAEMEDQERRRLCGVGRLVADVDHQEAEYAVLVGDAFQGRGLGSLLTDYCLEICRSWGIRQVVAEVAPENKRMLDIFLSRGFQADYSLAPDVVLVRREL